MRKKILIIEDEKILLKGIKAKLELAGYEVISAQDGQKGEELIEKEKPDLVLLDIILPGKNGFDILEELAKKGSRIPVIIISNSGQPVEIERALKLGANDYLIKAHFTPAEVLAKTQKILGGETEKEVAVGSLVGKVVLVLEDDPILRKVLGEKLTRGGFQTKIAVDANQALELIKQKKPDLILLDLVLPGMNGFEMIKHLKKKKETRDIPIIVISNLGGEDDIKKAKALGAVDYLIKTNFTAQGIVERVKQAFVAKSQN